MQRSYEISQGSDNVQNMVQQYLNRNKKKDKLAGSTDMEYGRYHPNSGIPVYSVDTDFDFEEEFRITLRKPIIQNQILK